MKNFLFYFTGKRAGRAFLAPTVLILLVLTIFPFLFCLGLTFGKISLTGGLGIQFVGIRNWSRLFSDGRFWNALSNTLFIVAIAVPLEYGLGLALALALNTKIKGRTIFRVVFLIPMMLTPIAVGYMWRMLFNISRGPINHIFPQLGLPPVEWLTTTGVVLYSIIITDIWHWTPFVFLILFAGLQTIPPDLTEAARIDGTSSWQLFRYVTFPLLIPASLAAILLRAMETFKIIDEIYIMTGGGPGLSSESMTLFGYILGLRTFDLAYGATIAFSLFIAVLIISIAFFSATKRFQEITLE